MDVYVPLAERIGLQDIKNMLVDLSLSHLNPEAYDAVISRLKFLRSAPEDLILPIEAEIKKLFQENNLVVTVSGREKKPLFNLGKNATEKNIGLF